MEAEIATQAVGLGGSTDFSLINLFFRADIVVKSVIIILILASVYSWALIIEKARLFKRIKKSTQTFEEKLVYEDGYRETCVRGGVANCKVRRFLLSEAYWDLSSSIHSP